MSSRPQSACSFPEFFHANSTYKKSGMLKDLFFCETRHILTVDQPTLAIYLTRISHLVSIYSWKKYFTDMSMVFIAPPHCENNPSGSVHMGILFPSDSSQLGSEYLPSCHRTTVAVPPWWSAALQVHIDCKRSYPGCFGFVWMENGEKDTSSPNATKK